MKKAKNRIRKEHRAETGKLKTLVITQIGI